MSMKRVLILSLVVALLGAGAAWAASVSPSRARLRHFVCQRALDPAGRAVSVTAVMRPINGTVKMALRFELLSRAQGQSTFSAINQGDLNSWIAPANPTLGRRAGDTWILNKQVVNLTAAPAVYRFRVQYRWTGSHNRVIGTAERDSLRCYQPELRPDLAVQSIAATVNPTQPNSSTYVATIANVGATAAGPFTVLFAPGGKTRSVSGLAPHSSVQVKFRGPTCSPTVTPAITVDPNDQVDDPNRANNSKAVVCPAVNAKALKRAGRGR
jgi:hypothetical protein